MKSPRFHSARYGHNDGQALILFLFFSIVLILFVGLGLDLGFAYVTKAQLSKAIDAASLAAVVTTQGRIRARPRSLSRRIRFMPIMPPTA